ncbi:TPA: restriction endonuclease subunit S [Photobacterium damselae]
MSELPSNWAIAKWKDITGVDGFRRGPFGGNLKKSCFVSEGFAVYEQYAPINNDCKQFRYFVSADKYNELSSFHVNSGDFLISCSGTMGRITCVPDDAPKGVINQALLRIRLQGDFINSDYFLKLFKSPVVQNLVLSKSVGGAIQNLAAVKELKEISLPLAPLNEQKRIVEKLDEVLAQVDTIKARLDGIPAILKRFRQSVLAAAVSGKLIDLNETKITTIGEVSEDIRYGTSKKCDYKGGSTPVIRIPNIGDRKLDTSDLKLADFTERELEKLALKTGDLLVIRSNGSLELVAKPALVEPQYEGFLYAGYLIRIRCDREKILPSFLLNVLSSRVVRDVVELGARSTSGVNNINSKELSALEFVLPSISEQKEIVRLVDQYFAFAETIEAQVKKAQTRVDNLTLSILAKAFRGELVEQDPNDEPADKLLERIAAARKEAEALAKAAKKAQTAKKRTVKKESAQES